MREFGMGIFGLALGGFLASTTYRYAVTHALTAGKDAPAAGQVYNAEASNTPIWTQGWKALAIAALSVVAPFGISSYVKSSSAKSFWQLAGFGGLGFFGVKAFNDVAAWAVLRQATPNQTGVRLFAPELMARSDQLLNPPGGTSAVSALSVHAVGTAGAPRLSMGLGYTVPPGSTMTPASSAASCPPGSSFIDAGADGKWCVTPPAPPSTSPPPPPPPPPPMTPPGGGPPMNPPGMCPPGPPSPPSQTVCLPAPPGTLTPPYASGGSRGGACCDSCARGGRCSCPINTSSDYLSVDMERA